MRERVDLPRARELRDDAALERFAADLRLPAGLRAALDLPAADERLAPEVEDFVRVDLVDFFAVERLAVERLAVERFAAGLRAPPARDDIAADAVPPLPALLEASLALHLPDMTRWAASATASAMIEPSLVALAMTLVAACDAVSAASSPASRIFLRAAGLALIAAAAAARPAASISLLIAALASLSTVLSREPVREEEELERDFEELLREELLRADLAIAYLPPSVERHFKAVPVPE